MSDETTPKTQEKFWPYALCAGGLLLILTLAILTPDFLNYRYRQDRLLHSAADAAAAQTNPTPAVGATATDQSKITTPTAPGLPFESPRPSEIYETYAKLVTMMLGFVSVVGVLAGYFVRKSVRELTEDVRIEVAREVKIFERDRTHALEKIKEAEDATKKALAEAERIKKEFEELLKKVSVELKAMNEMVEHIGKQKKSLLGNSRDTSAQVDAQLVDL